MSRQQRRLWEVECVVRGSALLHTGIALRLDGKLDEKRLSHAVGAVFRRHELLNTGFRAEGETLHLGPAAHHEPRVLHRPDLCADQAGHLVEIRRAAAAAHAETFPLTGEPLARAHLTLLGDDSAVLLLTFHRLVMDLFSLHQVVTDLQDAYLRGPDEPPTPADRYSALLAAREHRRSGDWEFWRTELSDFPTPWIGERRPEPGWLPDGAELRVPLDPDLTGLLRENARAARCTPTVFVTAAAARRVLERSGAADLVLATMSANRMNSDAVGPLAQAVLVRVGAAAPHGDAGVLAQVRRGLREGIAHQGVEFEEIVDLLTDGMGVARDDLAPLSVSVTGDDWRSSVAGLAFSPFDLDDEDEQGDGREEGAAGPVVRPSQLDVELNLSGTQSRLVLTYDRRCFGEEWCERFAADLLTDLATGVG
ncbi:condensation domain-containing protein [Streptomyces phaeoluteigriseus]|uniref:Condensation domain-containing protein n=1 Tax=Streptomyces phaeoluteigriseus TaxID=114686 RepID=A0ABY4ZD73_9ACTN|nr:condensation domain-containing protein [Streptomyces phaeoluteigriseus]USQ86277.1 condensation domain-containing protein [Streptomyces phaeoluteigriseus]